MTDEQMTRTPYTSLDDPRVDRVIEARKAMREVNKAHASVIHAEIARDCGVTTKELHIDSALTTQMVPRIVKMHPRDAESGRTPMWGLEMGVAVEVSLAVPLEPAGDDDVATAARLSDRRDRIKELCAVLENGLTEIVTMYLNAEIADLRDVPDAYDLHLDVDLEAMASRKYDDAGPLNGGGSLLQAFEEMLANMSAAATPENEKTFRDLLDPKRADGHTFGGNH